MKKILAIIMAFVMVVLTGCTGGDNSYDDVWDEMNSVPEEPSAANTSDAERGLEGTLTITSSDPGSSEYYTNILDFYAELFMEKNPKVTIEVEHFDWTTDISFWLTKTVTDLYSNNGSDIYATTMFTYENLGPKGLFVDLYYMMDNTESFNKNDYYSNIWKAMEVGGKLYSTPTHFRYPTLNLNNNIAEDLKLELDGTLSVWELADIFNRAKAEELLPSNGTIFNTTVQPYVYNDMEYGLYIDLKNKSYDFSGEELFDFMDMTLSVIGSDKHGYVDETLPDNSLADNASNNVKNIICEPSTSMNKTASHLVVDSNGNGVFNPINTLAISAASKNKELAWEFIKFIIEEKEMSRANDDKNYYKKIEYAVNGYDLFVPMNRINFNQVADILTLGDTDRIDYMNNFNQFVSVKSFDSYDAVNTLTTTLVKYETGQYTREQCREELNEKFETYFGEW